MLKPRFDAFFFATRERGEKKIDIRSHPLTCIFTNETRASPLVYLCSRSIEFLTQGCQ